jgi:hypothetical protein
MTAAASFSAGRICSSCFDVRDKAAALRCALQVSRGFAASQQHNSENAMSAPGSRAANATAASKLPSAGIRRGRDGAPLSFMHVKAISCVIKESVFGSVAT